MKRIILAFIIAPLAIPCVFAFPYLLLRPSIKQMIYGLMLTLLVGYEVELIFGIPLLLACRRYRINSLSAYASTGALLGLAVGHLSFYYLTLGHASSLTYLGGVAVSMTAASGAASIFWKIANLD